MTPPVPGRCRTPARRRGHTSAAFDASSHSGQQSFIDGLTTHRGQCLTWLKLGRPEAAGLTAKISG